MNRRALAVLAWTAFWILIAPRFLEWPTTVLVVLAFIWGIAPAAYVLALSIWEGISRE